MPGLYLPFAQRLFSDHDEVGRVAQRDLCDRVGFDDLHLSQAVESTPIILFFDQLNTPANEQAEVRRRLALWYQGQKTLAAPTCVILYTGWALRILQQPTLEAAKVRAAIESIPTTVSSQGAGATGELPLPAGANENLPIGFGDGPLRTMTRLDYFWHRAMTAGDTESALIYAGQLFAACPDEKALIWVSAGTTTKVWTAPLQAAQVKLYALNVHASIPYAFVTTFTTQRKRPAASSATTPPILRLVCRRLRKTRRNITG